MERTFRICAPFVVSEVIDGEAVIMDLRSGNYFSATGVGASIWQDIEAGRSYREILQSLTAQYEVVSHSLTDAVDCFLVDLIVNNLVEDLSIAEAGCRDGAPNGLGVASAKRAFDPNVLAAHTDLQDLLLLDPIHDVNSEGWPTRRT